MPRKIVCEGKVFCREGDLNCCEGCLNCCEGKLNTCEGRRELLRRLAEQGLSGGQRCIAHLSVG
jgi:iron only hydrogenase large subunit-like protein